MLSECLWRALACLRFDKAWKLSMIPNVCWSVSASTLSSFPDQTITQLKIEIRTLD